jgi:hypothetical protein
MSYAVIKADTPEELARRLNGMVLGKRNLIVGKDTRPNPSAAPNAMYKHPVAGLTLNFTTPVGTVTFSDNLTAKQIVDEINAALGPNVARLYKIGPNGQMVLALWDDATPVVLLHTGTANAYLGFATTAADPQLTQVAVAPTDIVSVVCESLSRQYVAFINV